jgi:hypothetical protein
MIIPGRRWPGCSPGLASCNPRRRDRLSETQGDWPVGNCHTERQSGIVLYWRSYRHHIRGCMSQLRHKRERDAPRRGSRSPSLAWGSAVAWLNPESDPLDSVQRVAVRGVGS